MVSLVKRVGPETHLATRVAKTAAVKTTVEAEMQHPEATQEKAMTKEHLHEAPVQVSSDRRAPVKKGLLPCGPWTTTDARNALALW